MSVILPNVILRGTFAARPAASSAGSLYFASDTGKQYRDNGLSWDEVTPTAGAGTVTHTGALTANLPVLGNGSADIKIGTAAQLVPTLPADPQKFLNGTGAFSTPSGSVGTDNLLVNASNVAALPWVGVTMSGVSAMIDNQGSFRAVRLTETGTSATFSQVIILPATCTMRLLLTVKKVVGRWFILLLSDRSANSFGKYFDLTNGVTGSSNAAGTAAVVSASITSLGSGWYTIEVIGTLGTSATYYWTANAVAGDGSLTTNVNDAVDLWSPYLARTA